MSFFKRGFEDYETELKQENNAAEQVNNQIYPFSLKKNETKEFIILDDTGFRFHEFSFYNPTVRRTANFTCRGDNDFLHAGKKPGLITVMTVKDLTGYLNKDGQRKGEGALKPLKLKKNAATRINLLRQDAARRKAEDMWNNQRQICTQKNLNSVDEVIAAIIKAGNVLKNCKIKATRIGDKSESSGDDFQLIEWVKANTLAATDIPFNYEEMFAVKSDEIIKQELMTLYNGQPPFDLNGTGQAPGQEMAPQSFNGQQDNFNGQQNFNSNNQSNQQENYSEAPNYTADDIPF
jgi:hypothetical protein